MQEQDKFYERYNRQIILNGFGEEGQRKLSAASVLVIGAGGLGCPALQYLAAAGVGKIGIVDDDVVSLSNLHRQVLFTTTDIGLPKTETAAKRLKKMNPAVQLPVYPFRLTNKNALTTLSGYDVVLDATDNFATRYVVNDACVLLRKPLVYGAVSQFEGQVSVFNCTSKEKEVVNYRDLFPQPPAPGSILNCAEAGVLGALPGIIGTMQATEVIKIITGTGKPLANRLLTYNALTNESFVFGLVQREETKTLLPKDAGEFEQRDYEWLCNSAESVEEITFETFENILQNKQAVAVDVREEGEQPAVNEFPHQKFPLSQWNEKSPTFQDDTIVLFCQSGKRSMEAAQKLSASFGNTKKIYSLKGGIRQWKEQHGKKV